MRCPQLPAQEPASETGWRCCCMETHELIQDVRKLVRSGGDDQADAAGEEAEDIIEDVAQALDAVLVQMEKPA